MGWLDPSRKPRPTFSRRPEQGCKRQDVLETPKSFRRHKLEATGRRLTDRQRANLQKRRWEGRRKRPHFLPASSPSGAERDRSHRDDLSGRGQFRFTSGGLQLPSSPFLSREKGKKTEEAAGFGPRWAWPSPLPPQSRHQSKCLSGRRLRGPRRRGRLPGCAWA